MTDQLTRDQIPAEEQWDLRDLFESPDAWEAERQELLGMIPGIQEFQGTLGESSKHLLTALKYEDELDERLGRLFAYAMLERDQDTRKTDAVQRYEQVMNVAVQASRASSFMAPELLTLSDEQLKSFLDEEPGLEPFRRSIEQVMRQRPHVRSAEVEEVLADSAEMAQGVDNAFTFLDNADIQFGTITDTDGTEIQLTKGRYQLLLDRREREVRKAAYEALHQPYMDHRNTLGALLTGSMQKDAFFARSHRYETSLEAALKPKAIPLDVYHNLIQRVRDFTPLIHRYLKLRMRILGIDDPHQYDLYVPLIEMPERQYSFQQASETILESFEPLGTDYLKVLGEGLKNRWVDVHEVAGKRAGGYNLGIYGVHPFILMNWNGSLNDVFTLAHEAGHAMHSHLSNTNQPHPTSSYTIFVAEVASTANEQLLTDYLLKQSDDPRERAYLINEALETIRTTIFRQTMFAEFELKAHELVESGAGATPDSLTEIYAGLVSDYYGPDLQIDEQVSSEWSRVPHFYRAYYVYQYATGLIAAMALAKQIIDGEPGSTERYLEFLSSGSSKDPLDLLRDAGVDLTTDAPYQAAFQTMESYLDQFEALVDELGIAAS
ncbi:MAG: oligoendopeptidase F [Sphaerobacteraceae bacterium]|nr:MAG: oligoendopeptidase F [Sphaerobacteraceae bacterium]